MTGRSRPFLAAAVAVLMLSVAFRSAAHADDLVLPGPAVVMDDVVLVRMAAAADNAGVDAAAMISIASAVEDAKASLRKDRAGLGSPDPRMSFATTSDTGVFGYDDKTWIRLVARHVEVAASGNSARKAVAQLRRPPPKPDAGLRKVLAMRRDPVFSTEVAAGTMHGLMGAYRSRMGRDATPGEMLSMHLFGLDAACRITRAAFAAPKTSTAVLIGASAGDPRLKPFYTSGAGAALTARSMVVSTEILMEVKRRAAQKVIQKYRA